MQRITKTNSIPPCEGPQRPTVQDLFHQAQPVTLEHHFVALQGDDEEVDAERLTVDGERGHGAYPKAG
jgi:hypothetical protein